MNEFMNPFSAMHPPKTTSLPSGSLLFGILLLMSLPHALGAQQLQLDEVGSKRLEHEKLNVEASIFAATNFSWAKQPWHDLEAFVKDEQGSGRTLRLILVYRDRMSAPRIEELMPAQRVADIDQRTLRQIANSLTSECLLLFYNYGDRGAFIQHPAQKQQKLNQLIDQL